MNSEFDYARLYTMLKRIEAAWGESVRRDGQAAKKQ